MLFHCVNFLSFDVELRCMYVPFCLLVHLRYTVSSHRKGHVLIIEGAVIYLRMFYNRINLWSGPKVIGHLPLPFGTYINYRSHVVRLKIIILLLNMMPFYIPVMLTVWRREQQHSYMCVGILVYITGNKTNFKFELFDLSTFFSICDH